MKQLKKSKQDIMQASLLIGELTDESIEKRVNAAKNITFIAEMLGNERIKHQLIPFLKQQIANDQPEVVLTVLANIQNLGEVLGGGVAFTLIFPLLEELIEYEEQQVRRKAIDKYYDVISLCDIHKCENQIITSLKRIYNSEYEEAKQAYCYVVSKKLGFLTTPNQQQCINCYLTLAQSPSMSIRKYASKYSKDLVQWFSISETVISKIIDLLFKDKEESNKIYLIDTVIELAKLKSPTSLQPYFNLISYQFSWRIRYELISKIDKLAAAMGKQHFKTFLTYFIKYLNDIEPEIRSIANMKLQEVISFLDAEEIILRIVPALKNISQDTHVYVRNSLASSILHLCPIIGKKATLEHILPKFLQLLKDQQEQIKQTIFKKVNLICETLGIETLSQSIIPILLEMFVHQNWRVRTESIEIFFYLIKNSNVAFLDEKNIKFIADFTKDRASAVRKQVIKLLINIIDLHGQPWFEKNLMSKLTPLFKSPTFVHRVTILTIMESLIPTLSQQYLAKNLFSALFGIVQDPVENVRMSLCNTLGVLHKYLPKQRDSIKKLLRNLKEDKDIDVKQIATKIFAKLD